MKQLDKIKQLREFIKKTLSPLINNDYLLFDLPHHSNLGDTLIWQGELDFLKTLPYQCKYSTGVVQSIFMAGKVLRPETILLFHGGGNFGDVWQEPNEFRKKVLRMYPNQPSIIFPQTIYYTNKQNLLADAAFYADYPQVTICARDSKSYAILQEYFPKNQSLLVPDMAFCLDINKYQRVKYPQGTIFVRREDKEINHNVDYQQVPKEADISDWIFLDKSKEYARQKDIVKWAARFDRRLGTDWKYKWLDIYWHHFLRPLNVKTAISFIDSYEHIYTTRMHAAILSVILGKSEITLFDNSYGKSSSFCASWLSDVDGLNLVVG